MCIDLSIMFGMLWSLSRVKKDGDARTQSLVRRLIRIVIETMAMPTLCMTMTAVMGLYYGDANSNERLFSYCQSQLCLFSLLHTLISRKDLRKALHGTTVALPTVTIHASDTPSADSQGHRFSRDSSGGVKSEGDNGDLSFHSTVSRATRLYEDSTLWATETRRHRALKDGPTDANTADIEAAHHMNPPPDKGIQSTGDIRHHKRVWQQADEVTSLPGALDLFLLENKPDAKGIPVL
ncbi:hypothetical protein QFC20_005319 [Naganishia adeliensis]|uniref:Uncharacterized protein n=1 Tax=Naganishia adeliensis TaxID=92952 RepID=A0ACC2VP12_9TREE|nr:hypothetical protein QFC20_005319 [Naganishia adeliensis]